MLYKHLRHQHRKYRKRYGNPNQQHSIKNKKFIDERPKIVDDKGRIGDWELDTIIGKNRKQAIVTMVERVTKFSVLRKVENRTAQLVEEAMINGLKPYLKFLFTLTSDGGSEFAYHEKISKKLNADFYFAHPYSSWERGLNENTNGLIRQYLPKGCDFDDVDEGILKLIMNKLNNRPRKTLGYKTPSEIFLQGISGVFCV